MAVTCQLCEKVFKQQFTLNRHYREVHKLDGIKSSSCNVNVCLEKNCNVSFWNRNRLIEHLIEVHDFTVETEELQFQNYDEFQSWKSIMEMQEKCSYIKQQGKMTKVAGSTAVDICYYVCSRSKKPGKVPEKKLKLRATKSQGSSKLNHACISKMTVKITGGSVNVHRVKTHYGHELELQHLRLSKEDAAFVAEKLARGASRQRILDANRSSIGTQLKRIHLLTRQDIVNIQRRYKIDFQDGVKHKNDAMDIDLWVKDCETDDTDSSPILFYKRQGEPFSGFEDQDFCLIVMNRYQEHMLTSFGHNVVCVDSTHDLNNYDFELTTLLIVDNYGEGFPVAFMFTNRKDISVHEKFFSIIKLKVGFITCKIFMSGITSVFLNAWSSSMGEIENKLLCAWHIDRAWKSNLAKISNIEKKENVYKTVKFLHENLDFENEDDFKTQLYSAVSVMLEDEDTKHFGVYFQKNYTYNYKEWAYFFRENYGISTNIQLESMHNVIKYFYLNGKTVKRLDKGLHAVLKYTHDKTFDRILKNTKSERTKLMTNIRARHKKAVQSMLDIEEIEENRKWIVKDNDCSYFVEKKYLANCCGIKCPDCDTCIHVYSCTCEDFFTRTSICKHIHYIASKCKFNEAYEEIELEQVFQDNEISLDSEIYLDTLSETCTNIGSVSQKESIVAAVADFQQTFNSITDFSVFDDSIVNQVCSLLENAKALLTNR